MTDGSLAQLKFKMRQDQVRLDILKLRYPSEVLDKAVKAAQDNMNIEQSPEESWAAAKAAANEVFKKSGFAG